MTASSRLVCLAILLPATVGIIAAQSSPKQSAATEKAKQSDQNQKAADKASPPTVEQPSSQTSGSSDHIEIQRKLVKYTIYLAVVGGLQFIALIVQAVAFWRTLEAVRIQATLMGKHAEHLENLAAAARDNAKAAKASADALINSERAWILVDIGKLPPFKPDPNQLQFLWIFPTIKNYGKTVARITRVAGIVKLISEGEKLPVVPEYILGQGFDEQIDTVLPPEVPMQPRLGVSGDELIQVQQGKLSLFVHGFIEYFDGVSEKQRRSAYCFGYVIQGGFSPAETGFYPYLAAPREYTECT